MNKRVEQKFEKEHLLEIIAIARGQLEEADRAGEFRQNALVEARRELNEQTEQMFSNLWASQDFEALVQLNQLAQPLAVRQKTREMELLRIQALVRMLDTPYFARIDMRFDDGGDTERVYIGRATLKDEKTQEIHIHDWRSPIASVFYRYGVGNAQYDAPAGRITGEVLLKRQYEIRRGELLYFFDADVQIQDEFLRAILSKNASPRMKAIVETIQRDQDVAIRDMDHELVMVQGVAGSGKSSIALSRVAYLMYEGLSARLNANDILILSPNALFERYIEDVLPELGERSVAPTTLERLIKDILDLPVEPRSERFESLYAGGRLRRASMAFKATRAFLTILERFAEDIPRRHIAFQDVAYGGETIATRQRLKARLLRGDPGIPLGTRLSHMEISLWDGIRERRPKRMEKLGRYARRFPARALEAEAIARAHSIRECGALNRVIRSFTRLHYVRLYRALFADEAYFKSLAGALNLPEDISAILGETVAALSSGKLRFEDAAAIAYLKLILSGAGGRSGIRQVVVDEAQDYGMVEYGVLNRLFPGARFTVLGDVNQVVDRSVNRAHYEGIEAVLNRRSAAFIELTKSFRCTGEILRFSQEILKPDRPAEGFNRSGDAPGTFRARDGREMEEMIGREIELCRARGYKSIALIVKTARDATEWSRRLRGMEVRLIDGGAELTGAFVIPLILSKGLEFDAVLLLDADRMHYGEAEDKNLLYVGCTRALHRLNLFFEGEPSPHLPIEEEVKP